MTEPTTIIWCTLPSKGNKGAAIIKWRNTTADSTREWALQWSWPTMHTEYLLGAKPARYPVPAINDAWLADPIWEQWVADAN